MTSGSVNAPLMSQSTLFSRCNNNTNMGAAIGAGRAWRNIRITRKGPTVGSTMQSPGKAGKPGGLLSPAAKKIKDNVLRGSVRSPSTTLGSPTAILERSHALRLRVQGLLDRGSARKPARPAQAEPSPDDSSSEDDGRGRLFPNLTDRGRASAAASVASAPTAIVKTSPQKGFQPRAMSVASTADISTSFIERERALQRRLDEQLESRRQRASEVKSVTPRSVPAAVGNNTEQPRVDAWTSDSSDGEPINTQPMRSRSADPFKRRPVATQSPAVAPLRARSVSRTPEPVPTAAAPPPVNPQGFQHYVMTPQGLLPVLYPPGTSFPSQSFAMPPFVSTVTTVSTGTATLDGQRQVSPVPPSRDASPASVRSVGSQYSAPAPQPQQPAPKVPGADASVQVTAVDPVVSSESQPRAVHPDPPAQPTVDTTAAVTIRQLMSAQRSDGNSSPSPQDAAVSTVGTLPKPGQRGRLPSQSSGSPVSVSRPMVSPSSISTTGVGPPHSRTEAPSAAPAMHQPHHVSFAMDTAHSVSRDEPVSAPQAVRQRTLFDAHAEAGSVYVLGGPKHAPKPQPQLERPSLSKVYKHPDSYRAPVRVLPAVDSRPSGVVNRFPSPPRTSSPPPAELDARMEAAVLTQYNDHLTHELESAQVGYTQLRLQYEEEVGVLRAKLRDLESSTRTNPSQHQLVETLQLEVRSLRHECSQLRGEREELLNRYAIARAAAVATDDGSSDVIIEDLQSRLQESNEMLARCTQQLQQQQAERLQWETEREGTIEELASAREAQSSSQELQAAVEAMKQCESKLSASEAEVKRLSDVLASSTVTVQATAQENSLLKESLQMLQEKEGDSTRTVLILEERCRGLSQQIAEQSSSVAQAVERQHAAESAMSSLQQTLQAKVKELGVAQSEASSSKQTLESALDESASLARQLARAQQAVADAKKETDTVKQRLAQANGTTTAHAEQVKTLFGNIAALEGKLEAAVKEKDESRRQLMKAQENVQAMSEEMQKMDKLLQDSSSQITNWATEVATLRANNAELSDALAAESSQSAEYQRDIAALKEECEAYNVDRVSAGDAIAVAEHYKAVAEANEEAFGRLSEQLSVYTQKLDGLQADLVSVVEQRDTVTRERDSLQSSVKVQETSLTQQLQQYKEMQARCTQLEGQLSESASAKQNVDASVTALRRQFTEEQQQWRTTEHVLTGEIRAEKLAQAKQAGEIRELKEYLSAALSKAESSDTAVRSAKSECAKLLSELQASTSQLQSLQSDQLSLRNELSSLRATNEALEAKLRSVSQDARDTSQAATAQAYRVGALEAEIHRLTAELQSQTVRTNGLSAELASEKSLSSQRVASLETQLREATATVKSTQSELDAITGGFHAAQKEVATLSDALRLAEAELNELTSRRTTFLSRLFTALPFTSATPHDKDAEDSVATAVERLCRQQADAVAKLEDAERTRMRLEAEVSAGLIEGGRMTRELMTAQTQCNAMKDELRVLKDREADARARTDQLVRQLNGSDDLKHQLEAAHARLTSALTDKSGLQRDNANLQSRVVALSKEHRDIVELNTQLMEEKGRLEGEVLSLQMGIAAAKTAAADAVAAAKAKASSPRRTPAEPYIDLSDGISTPSTGTLGRSGTTIPPVSVSPPQSHTSGVSATVSPTSADRRRVHFSPHDQVRLIPTAVENAANQYVSPVGEDDSPVTPAKAAVDDPAKLLMSLKRQLALDLKAEEWAEIEAALGLSQRPSAEALPRQQPASGSALYPLPPLTFPSGEGSRAAAAPAPAEGIAVHHRRSVQTPHQPKGPGNSWLDTLEAPWKS